MKHINAEHKAKMKLALIWYTDPSIRFCTEVCVCVMKPSPTQPVICHHSQSFLPTITALYALYPTPLHLFSTSAFLMVVIPPKCILRTLLPTPHAQSRPTIISFTACPTTQYVYVRDK